MKKQNTNSSNLCAIFTQERTSKREVPRVICKKHDDMMLQAKQLKLKEVFNFLPLFDTKQANKNNYQYQNDNDNNNNNNNGNNSNKNSNK